MGGGCGVAGVGTAVRPFIELNQPGWRQSPYLFPHFQVGPTVFSL